MVQWFAHLTFLRSPYPRSTHPVVAYLIIIKDTVPTVLGTDDGARREFTLILFSLFIMVPLSMQRDMASLSMWSFLSVMADVILVIFVAAVAPIKLTVSEAGGFGNVFRSDWISSNLFVGLGVLSTAMACQHSAFIISSSLQNHTSGRWKLVTTSSISFAAILCAVMGLCGYFGFLDSTAGNILRNFSFRSVAANGARALLAITMFFTYPMESFVARHVLMMFVHQGDMDATHSDGVRDGGGILCLNRRRLWTLVIYGLALFPALFINDLGPVLSITGALGGSSIAYIAPGLVYLGVNGESFLDWCSKRLAQGKKAGSSASNRGGEVELPMAGDADQKIAEDEPAHVELPVAGEQRTMVSERPLDGPKPFWWYLGLFPLWCAIANKGSKGMSTKLALVAEDEIDSEDGIDVNVSDGDYQPSPSGFCMAIFFIIFGIVAGVAGIVSNVFVQYAASHVSY